MEESNLPRWPNTHSWLLTFETEHHKFAAQPQALECQASYTLPNSKYTASLLLIAISTQSKWKVNLSYRLASADFHQATSLWPTFLRFTTIRNDILTSSFPLLLILVDVLSFALTAILFDALAITISTYAFNNPNVKVTPSESFSRTYAAFHDTTQQSLLFLDQNQKLSLYLCA